MKNVIHYTSFPKKYQRHWSELVDPRFGLIWLITFIFHFSFALYFSLHPPVSEITFTEINKIQKQYAELILKPAIENQKDAAETPIKKEANISFPREIFAENQKDTEPVSEGTATVKFSGQLKEESSPVETQRYYSYNRINRASNEKLLEEVNSKGLLALLGNESENGKEKKADALLGEAANRQNNFKRVLGNVSNLQSNDNSQSRGTVKGSRVQSNEKLDGLIASREQAATANVQRQGGIIAEELTLIKSEKDNVVGNRDPDEISVAVNRHNAAIQSCYERGLQSDPDLKGKLVVRFTITTDGRVKNVKLISSTLNNSRVERCIVGKIRRWDDFGQIDNVLGNSTVRQVYMFGY